LGVTVLLIVALVSTASADQTSISSIYTNPSNPIYNEEFTIFVHILNPPEGGFMIYSIGGMTEGSGYAPIDSEGIANFDVSIMDYYSTEPSTLRYLIHDSQGNIVLTGQQYINIYKPSIDSITINPSNPVYNQDFTVSVHVSNPSFHRTLYYEVGDPRDVLCQGEALIDDKGIANFVVSLPDYYKPSILKVSVPYGGNDVRAEKLIEFGGEIPEFPSIALPVVSILGIIAIIGCRKE